MQIEFKVFQDGEHLVAKWDAPLGFGGITTQAKDLNELLAAVREAIQCHFDDDEMPEKVKFHFESDPILAVA